MIITSREAIQKLREKLIVKHAEMNEKLIKG